MADKIDDGGPAFQVFRQHALGRVENDNNGMSLRDWFAGQALANPYTAHENSPDKIGEWAYQVADAMIAARKAGA